MPPRSVLATAMIALAIECGGGGAWGAAVGKPARPPPSTQHTVVKAHRLGAVDTRSSVGFVHIAKCAGASWIVGMRAIFPHFYPQRTGGPEHCYGWQREAHPAIHFFSSLKSPRHHVWSLFTECKYDPYYVRTLKHTGFVRSTGATEAADLVDFERWLDHFLGHWDDPDHRTAFNTMPCYHPANFQARALSCSNPPRSALTPRDPGGAHNVLPPIPGHIGGAGTEPDVAAAIEAYWSLSWVGIAEFYHASKCLLWHRIRTSGSNIGNGTQGDAGAATSDTAAAAAQKIAHTARAYVTKECRCPLPESRTTDNHVMHHAEGHRETMSTVPTRILDKIDRVTRVDILVYRAALLGFMSEIELLEAALGRRVLCDDVLAKAELELPYASLNLTAIYLGRGRGHG